MRLCRGLVVSFTLLLSVAANSSGDLTLEQLTELAISGATASELAYIEDRLANMDKLTLAERTALRKLIIKIALREQKEIAEAKRKLQQQRNENAIQQQLDQLRTVSPDAVVNARQFAKEIDKAKNKPIKPVRHIIETRTIDINNPNPVQIPIVPHMGATIILLDANGQPFPITGISDYTGDAFSVAQPDTPNHNVLTITNTRPFAESNISVFLEGLGLPVIFALQGSDSENATRLTLRTRQTGPKSPTNKAAGQDPTPLDDALYKVADYQLPPNAEQIKFNPQVGEAWKIGKHIYLRTQYRLISPYATQSLETHVAGAVNVYQIPHVSSVVLLIDGKTKRFAVGEG